jgi:hypothetical protein
MRERAPPSVRDKWYLPIVKKSSGPTARATGDGRADVQGQLQSTHSQALPSLLDAPPSLTAPLAQLACATPASALRMAGAACPEPALRMARTSRLLAPLP